MIIANATGCSSIYNGSTPSTPFCTDENNEGPAWANSLFEDNAEFGYGMKIANDYKTLQILNALNDNMNELEPELQEVAKTYIENINNREKQREIKDKLVSLVEASSNQNVKTLLDYKNDIVTKSQWIIGGDGWAYDIGFGGLDHVLANNENVNILVLDTEVYSNTGGQASKSSQTGAIAKFAASGKKTAKKDLAQIAMSYGHVYVAQVNMGANNMQVIKAMKEAESYDGPSLIIAYCPCIEHGIRSGMLSHQQVQKKATECGYFNIYRYDPRLKEEGKNPLQLDFKEPDFTKFKEFVLNETRFASLSKINPDNADALLDLSIKYAQNRFEKLDKASKE
jgi:pyruvate-ferredoxin/flavodoxin oxidoreductase